MAGLAIENSAQTGILIVEDESVVACDIKLNLESMGYSVVGIASRSEQAMAMIEDPSLKIVLMDIHLKNNEDGVELASRIRAIKNVPVVYITAFTDEKTLSRAMETSSYGYIVKPFQKRELRIAIELAIYKFGYEMELKREIEMARESNRLKNEFLSNIGHELKTPLNSIIGFSAMTMERCKDKEILEYVDIIGRSAKTLLSLIMTLLDTIKLENGMFSLIPSEFNLSNLVGECLDVSAVNAHGKGIDMYYCWRKETVSALFGDERVLRQVIMNLLDNAIKFTDSGHVRLEVWTELAPSDEDPSKVDAMFRVSDTGIGIAKEDVARIFERFTQLDPSMNRRAGGSGLGLAIVRGFVELVNGSIDVESAEGKGSSFTVRLPMKALSFERPIRSDPDRSYVFVGFPVECVCDLRELGNGAPIHVVGLQANPASLPEGAIVVYSDDAISDALFPDCDPLGTMLDLTTVSADHELVVALHIGSTSAREIKARGLAARFVTLPVRETLFNYGERRDRIEAPADSPKEKTGSRPFDGIAVDEGVVRRNKQLLLDLYQAAQAGDEAKIEMRLKEAGERLEKDDKQSARFAFMVLLVFRKTDAAALLAFLEERCMRVLRA